jgi:hypothetical protein
MSKTVVFTGPTLDEDTIHEILPAAQVVPPVGAGDLLRIPLKAGDVVAIIDGFYFQAAAVRHKEILDLLQRGVHVWGAASMGALRAAELATFGMRGFGSVFQAYADGAIDGDDEVAIIHAPQDMDYIKLTEALVNIRYACQMAVAEGLLTQEHFEIIFDLVKAMPFFERSYPNIWQQASERGLPASVIEILRSYVQQKRLDLKRSDALMMIKALQTPPLEPYVADFALFETSLLHNWRIDEQGFVLKEQWISYRELLCAYQIFCATYTEIHYQLLLQQLATQFLTHIPAGRTQREQVELIAQHLSAHYGFSLNVPLPEEMQRWLFPEEQALSSAEQLIHIAIRLWHAPSSPAWQEGVIQHIKTSASLPELVKIVYQTRQLCQKLQEEQGKLLLARLYPEKIYTWLMQRWRVTEAEFDIALRAHGFSSRRDCWLAVSSFYLYDRYIGGGITSL